MKILNRIYLFFAVVILAVSLAQCIYWSKCFGAFGIGYLIHLLPSVVFIAAYVVGRKTKRKAVHAVAISLCLLALLFWGFVTAGFNWLVAATAEVTNLGRYEEILSNSWKSREPLVRHFPRVIPSDAKDVRFSFSPAFLQGGAHIQLRYAAAPATISELYEQFSGKMTKSFMGGDTNDHMNVKQGMPTTFFYTNGSASHQFPDDYEIMIFDELPKEEQHSWNHGDSHGVAISKKRNEIVYWAESW
jgi:hypothetical protein